MRYKFPQYTPYRCLNSLLLGWFLHHVRAASNDLQKFCFPWVPWVVVNFGNRFVTSRENA
ncbi:Hypothetical protein OINT_1002511 [Brucella intermedia LMG 3301]|uniref:Uncharacterized protein n=1 Tax=Brucella intermedia LMG 3301 TaxID=641118 RepID=C4WEJ3_9HYPH|nr:Hypothetical protein OINT_1002511 [Brucella intermedia LMG 3301]